MLHKLSTGIVRLSHSLKIFDFWQIPNEVELLRELRAKVGPHSNNQRLLFHIRSSRGKLHWAGEM